MHRKYFLIPLLAFSIPNAFGIAFIFDYTYDTNNFFTAERREVVNLAAQNFSELTINRSAITPSGPNTWSWQVPNPSNYNQTITITDPTIGAQEIRVYLGAQTFAESTLGQGGNVGYNASGTSEWIDLLTSTNTAQAYKPFGGNLSLNLSSNWCCGTDPNITPGAYDMYSIVSHELGHVLGFGLYNTVDAWDANVNNLNHTFTGSTAAIAYGGDLPLTTDNNHVASGTTFEGQTMIMVPGIPAGTRRHWTLPELETLVDIGYVAIPEPSALLLLLLGIPLLRRGKTI